MPSPGLLLFLLGAALAEPFGAGLPDIGGVPSALVPTDILSLSHLLVGDAGPGSEEGDLHLAYDTVARLAGLPLHCYNVEFPYKLGLVTGSLADVRAPSEHHPIFHGCFDWHSAVHGHWLLARAAALFPGTPLADNVTTVFREQFTEDKVAVEMENFQGKFGKHFERTYGWVWLLKLQQQLESNAQLLGGTEWSAWASTLRPLASTITELLQAFLPKLVYPVRHGEHPNTAFGLALGLDYARAAQPDLEPQILTAAKGFYFGDRQCPLSYEPSGSDFLSPCLQEADLMARVLEGDQFRKWCRDFLPQLFNPDFILEPAEVRDRSDGKLVHLDGLNFSRAWALYRLARTLPDQGSRLRAMGDAHVRASLEHVVGSDYLGSHWLATFLLYALEQRAEA